MIFIICFDFSIIKLKIQNKNKVIKSLTYLLFFHAGGDAMGSAGTKIYKLTIPKTTITKLIKYWLIPVPFFFLQKVERIKKRATQIRSLFLINIPALQRSNEINEAPSGYSWRLSFLGSNKVTPLGFLLERLVLDISRNDIKDWL